MCVLCNAPTGKTRALLELSFGFESCWSGDLEDAARRADAVCASAEKGSGPTLCAIDGDLAPGRDRLRRSRIG